MIAPVVGFGQGPLGIDGAAELTAPDHQGLVQQPPLFEVRNQRPRAAVRVETLVSQLGGQRPVLVPAPVHDLHHTDPALHQTARHQSAVRKTSRFAGIGPVQVQDALRFVAEINQFRNASLHSKCHLVLGNPRLDLRIAHPFKTTLVEGRQRIEHCPAFTGAHTVGIGQVQHRIPASAQRHPVVAGGQKTAGPHS